MTGNRLIVDIDETILNFSDSMQAFLVTKGHEIKERMRDQHNIPKLFNLDLPETLELISEFHRSPAMGQLEPEPCAAIVLPLLHRSGYRFVAISACLAEPHVVRMRKRNLEDAFGFAFEEVHCIGLALDKTEALRRHEPAIWVEDMARHAAAGADLGHRAFLLDRPYNHGQDHPGVTRVTDWHEIARMVAPEVLNDNQR